MASEKKVFNMRSVIRKLRWIHLLPVFAFLSMGAWALASPIGASPDDNYHLASIWCANGNRTDLCATDPTDANSRLILPGLANVSCFVADINKSASCQKLGDSTVPSVSDSHGNWNGAYPPFYYAVMNAFASHDIQASALLMRFVNIAIFILLVTVAAYALSSNLRVPMLAGFAITSVPLSIYLVSSNNPGSWSVTGVGLSWICAIGWFNSTGRRSWVLGTLTAIAVIIAAGSRTDAAVYSVIGLAVGTFIGFRANKSNALKLILPVALAIVAFGFYISSGYSSVASNGLGSNIPDSGSRDRLAVLAFNSISIPRIWTGIFGSWGLGWRMETWPGYWSVEFATLVVFIGLASLGIRQMFLRKSVSTLVLVAILFALPLYVLTAGLSVVSENVQPRYLLPLVIVLAGLLLLTKTGTLNPGPWHIIPAIVLLAISNVIAIYSNLRRYLTGLDVEQLSLDSQREWWWSGMPFGPTVVWVLGSIMFAVTVAILGITWLRDRHSDSASTILAAQ